MIRKTHKYLVIASDGLWDMVDDRVFLDTNFFFLIVKKKKTKIIIFKAALNNLM